MSLSRNKQISINPVLLGFWLLSVLIFCNVNGITYLLFGSLGIVSPIIILCCLFIFGFLKIRKEHFSKSSILFISSLASVFILSIFPALYYYGSTNFQFSFLTIAFRESVTSILIFSAFFLVMVQLSDEGKYKYLKYIFYLFIFTTTIGALEPVLGLRNVYTSYLDTSRTLGFFGNPNETGLQANYTLVMALGLYLMRRINLLFTLVIFCLALYTSFSTFSKMAMIISIAMLIGFLLFFLIQFIRLAKNNTKRSMGLIGLIVLLSILVVLPNARNYYNELRPGQQKRLNNAALLIWEGKIDEKTTSYRNEIFKEALDLIKRKPLFGYGTHTFSKGGMFRSRSDIGVHNLYLKIIGEAGIIPLAIFFWFIISFFVNSLRIKDKGLFFIIAGCMAVYLIYAMSDHTAFAQKVSIGLLAVLCALLASKQKNTTLSNQQNLDE